ncbi:TetR/AcrR family transcriptional regulator [Companilactobacillus mishanensis]|uniref:TetR/AcrR family transcriptional regulator n=1 Tax=Companilactobacillus mishanensis TaxID=2486008 RepID=UPI000F789E1E|nr:TetR/AcrR family transcriptional regulator [Companilactobacillus mishanensis]
MNGNDKRKKLKKQDILDAATACFMENGYKKTSVADIAKAAKSSQVTLYKYYESKVDLARAVVMEMVVGGYAQYDKQLDDSSKSFMDKMQDMMVDSVDISDNISNDFFKFMVDEFQGRNGDTKVMHKYNNLKFGFWKKLLDQGRAENVVSKDISDSGAMIYLDMYVDYVMRPDGVAFEKAVEMKKHEKELVHLFFYGIIGK